LRQTIFMARSTIIDTVHLRIEPFTEQHLTLRYVGWLNDPEVVRFSEQRFKTNTLESCRDYMQSFENTANHFWALVARDAKLGHIGNMNAYVDSEQMIADLGIMIGEKKVWAQGYGLEAWLAVIKYLFKSGMTKVTAGTLSVNSRMLVLMRRAGMGDEIYIPRESIFEGGVVDTVKMSMYRSSIII
jgi:ribosomal-protein-alanine N-acetyltransferase